MVTQTCDLVERLKTFPDHRRQCRNLKHRLHDILVLGFCGILAGCDDFVEIADWASDNAEFFGTFLELPQGIPSHDTFSRVFASVKPAAVQAVLLPWLLERRGLPGDWIHLDGKTMRHTRRDSTGLGALHIVSARAGQTGLTLGQVAVDAKSHEITAMPQLLQLLDLRQKIVTTDAMGCQKENGLPWVLDVVFREDARRVYDRMAAQNIALLNRLALSLSRGDPSKRSLKVKRKRAGRNMAYLAELLGFPGI